MEPRLTYYYAIIDTTDGMCVGVETSITPHNHEQYVEIEGYNEDYLMKYYNRTNGQWYEDAAFTIPWSPNN